MRIVSSLAWLLMALGTIVALVIMLLPYAGIAYLISMIGLTLGLLWEPWQDAIWGIWRLGALAYLPLTVITFVLHRSWGWDHCCVGGRGYLAHCLGCNHHLKDELKIALAWPIGWYMASQSLAGWGVSVIEIVIDGGLNLVAWPWKRVTIEVYTPKPG